MRRIVLNALQMKKDSSGIGVLIRELFIPFTRLTDNECTVLLSSDSPDFPAAESLQQIRIKGGYSKNLQRLFYQLFLMGYKHCKNSVLITTDSKIPLLMPKSCVPIPIVTDMALYRVPEAYKKSRIILWKLQYRLLLKRAPFFFAVSEFTGREMTELLGIPGEKIHILPCACAANYARASEQKICEVKAKLSLEKDYILFVGNLNPRKNLRKIFEAFDIIASAEGDIELVIAGEYGWRLDIRKALSDIKNADRIRFLGFVSDENMPALYSGARLLLYPSVYEGFGLPILEAQACGTPVVTGNVSAMPEVGGDAAVYADPGSAEDIAEKVIGLLNSPDTASELVLRGYDNLRRYDWTGSARLMDNIISSEIKNELFG